MFDFIKTKTIVAPYEPIEFPVLDNEDLTYRFNVAELAKNAARENRPDMNYKGEDANELDFHHKIETYAHQATIKVKQLTEDLRNNITSTSINKEITDVENVEKEFKNKVSAEFTPLLTELAAVRGDVIAAEDDLSDFKKVNKLRRSADYPESHVLTLGILVFALLIESLLNGFFFAKGSDFGLVGGVSIALIVSLLNISIGYLSGWWVFRYKNHISRKWVYCSTILFISTVVVSIVFNLLVAHYREALGVDPEHAATLAVSSFQDGLLSITDVESWLLFMIGIVFFSLAVYKGYSMDDPYPGYGKMSRKRNRLLGDLDELRKEMIDDLDELHQYHLEIIEIKYVDLQRRQKLLNGFISSFEYQMGIYRSYIKNLRSNLNYIIATYRDINTSERTAPPPAYFDSKYNAEFDLDEVSSDYDDKRYEIARLLEGLADSLPAKKAYMLNFKEEYHQKIDEVAKL
ncbi:hypothetical protein [Alkalimarinus alittae]|uniref:Transmembrane protein n=1 Tax=Alkalimarinus alittae TaxID=2961619 RepID=A0ABY6N532_9ALTE|nr:hypothetical protein [Alkalimarinus alittae]UZE97220.1 hypothetical protein NKI27_05580 [Alkalimarinus alittae]